MKKLLSVFVAACQFLGMAMANVGDVADLSALANANYVQGDLTQADLEGKVILLEYWGTNCGPCVAAMPHLQALYDKYKDEGLVIIGSELQRSSRDRIENYLRQSKLTFPICMGLWLPQVQMQGNLPTTAVIGADGKVVFIGKPHQADAVVEAELQKLKGADDKSSKKSDKKAGKKDGKKKDKKKNKKK